MLGVILEEVAVVPQHQRDRNAFGTCVVKPATLEEYTQLMSVYFGSGPLPRFGARQVYAAPEQ